MSDIIQFLTAKEGAISAGCSITKRQTARQMLQAASIAIHQNPGLAKCSKESIYESVLNAARMGLDCSGLHGHGYLVPYGRKCTFVPGWQGLISIAIRSGAAKTIKANVVFANDEFDWDEGLAPNLIHKPRISGIRGDVIAAYAVAYFDEAAPQFEVVLREDAEKIAKESRSDSWRKHFGAMIRKTAIRKLCGLLPRSLELDDALDIEIAAEDERATAADLRATPIADLVKNPDNTVEDVKRQIKARKPRAPRKPRKRAAAAAEEIVPTEEQQQERAIIIASNAALLAAPDLTDDEIPF